MSDPAPVSRPRAETASLPLRSAWARYALALAAVAAATLLTLLLNRGLGTASVRVVFIFFFPAVFLSARFGGRGAGVLAIALSALIGNYFFLPPYNTFSFNYETSAQTGLFLLVASLLVSLQERSRRAEASAQRSEESLFTTLKSIGDAVIATDERGCVTFMNAVAERLTGWPAGDARGRPLREVFHIVNEQTREEVESPVVKVLREGAVVGLANHTLLLARDGREVPIDDSGAPIKNHEGRTTGVVLVFHDVTERRQAEEARERLAAIVESSEDAIIGKTLDGTITSWNAAARRLYGYTPEEAVGQHISFIFPPESGGELEDILGHIRRGERLKNHETVRVRKDGTRVNVSISISPVNNSEGERVGASTIARDITERKRAEERLRQRERELTDFVENATIGLHWVGADGTILWANRAELEMLGYSHEEYVGRNISEFHADPPVISDILQRLTGREVLDNYEARLRHKDGSIRHVVINSSVMWDDEGNFVHTRCFTRDITEYRQAEEERARLHDLERRASAEVVASEQRYRALADAMPQIVWTADAGGAFDYYNRRWFEYTGLDFEQSRGWGWQPALHPEDLEQAVRRWAQAVTRGEKFTLEYRLRRASDGQHRWHLQRAVPLRDAAGRVVKWFGTATDIHEKREAEERVRFLAEAGRRLSSSLDYETTLAELARLGVEALADYCLIDLVGEDGRVRRAAAAHADAARQPLVERLRAYPPDLSKPVGVAAALETGRPSVVADADEEFLKSFARGGEHLALLRELGVRSFLSVPLVARGRTFGALSFAATGAPRAYTPEDVSFAEELSRRAALALDNARLYGRARDANRVKDEFLATLSHELRTPLTPIIGWTHMLRSGRLAESDLSHGLRVIDKNSQSLSRLINDLLDMSSIMSGKMKIVREPVRLSAALQEAVETVRPQAESGRVALEAVVDEGAAHLGVSGDRTRLVQIFWNLLNNAVKFSREGGRVVVLLTRAVDGRARVEVADEGQGIPPSFMPHVFERFRQADGSTTRAHGGLGIGLALVKSLVEAHGGEVSAASDGEGRGSRFTVLLPALAAPAPRDAVSGELAQAPEEPCAEGVCRVLLVEDARDTLEMLRVVFEARGYQTESCATPEEALRVAGAGRFDIIVSDIGLPRIDGYELIRQLRSLPHLGETPAVALTGYAAPRDAEAAREAGFDTHIPKPVDPAALADQVEQLLKQRARRDGGDSSKQ